MWQSPVYCNSLENCRVEMLREFESHRFRQIKCACGEIGKHSRLKICRRKACQFDSGQAHQYLGELTEWPKVLPC